MHKNTIEMLFHNYIILGNGHMAFFPYIILIQKKYLISKNIKRKFITIL